MDIEKEEISEWKRLRNIEFAYEMIGMLRRYNTTVTAIDQPVDFGIPESSLMHAVYLAIPQAENERRSLNTKSGIQRARQLGRYPNKAPIGYTNQCAIDGKKYIAPYKPDADLIKWSFQQLAKNTYRIEDVRRMANAKGLQCSRSNFWKLLHNPVYCGYVTLSSNGFEEKQLVKGIHEPIITQTLYNEVQNIIDTKRKVIKKVYTLNEMFVLQRHLICPACSRMLYGSSSKGRSKKYPYYHCRTGCKTRFKADVVNENYESKLKELKLSTEVIPLFDLVVKDINVNTQLDEHLNERRLLLKQIREKELFIAKARSLFVVGKIEFNDFYNLKKEYSSISNDLNDELKKVMIKLTCIKKQFDSFKSFENILSMFSDLNVNDKKQLINFIPPSDINIHGVFSLQISRALSKIISNKQHSKPSQLCALAKPELFTLSQQAKDRKVSVKKAVELLAKGNIHVDEDEAGIILDFLYFVAKFSRRSEGKINNDTLSGNRTLKKPIKALFN